MKCISLISVGLGAFLSLLLALHGLPEQAAGGGSAPSGADAKQIDRWIRQLGDDDFDVREEATRQLRDREDVAPALRKALLSPDAEVHKRAAEILAALDGKRACRGLDKALELGKDGRIDEVVERLVRWQGSDDGRKGWQAVYQLADKAAEIAARESAAKDLLDLKFFPMRGGGLLMAQPAEVAFPPMTVMRRTNYLIRGEAIDLDARTTSKQSIIAASRSVRLSSSVIDSTIVVCGGTVETNTTLGCIILCDGDFKAHSQLGNCVVIARGKVTCAPMTGGVFISAREVEFPHGGRDLCVVRTGDAHPLGLIRFFDPAEAGVEASVIDDRDGGRVPDRSWRDFLWAAPRVIDDRDDRRVPDGVVVKGVAKDKPFAAAGLQAGDVITAVGDEKIDASGKAADQFDSFRRPLRKMVAADEEFTLTVRRGDKTLDLTVKPAD